MTTWNRCALFSKTTGPDHVRTPTTPADKALRRETIAELDLLGVDLEDRFERITRLVSLV